MSDKTGIEWTDATWNPIRGCSRVSAGCQHCYAETVARRFSGKGQPYDGLINRHGIWNGRVNFYPHMLNQPLRWRRPRRIFVNSMSDLFHENLPENAIAAIFAIMAAAPHHTFQVLTKRPRRMQRWLRQMTDFGAQRRQSVLHEALKGAMGYDNRRRPAINDVPWPLPNVWVGTSIEDQGSAESRLPWLIDTPAAIRWVSFEPLLGSIVGLNKLWTRRVGRSTAGYDVSQVGVHWAVVGGESGRGARPMRPEWARSLRDQCRQDSVAFLFKQWGEHGPARFQRVEGHLNHTGGRYHYEADPSGAGALQRLGKKASGRLLDGRLHDGYPA